MKKEEALRILYECAELYQENLLDNKLLFLCIDKHKRTSTLSVQFSTANFLHLTGIKFTNVRKISPGEFFYKCLKKRLELKEFDMADDGTTEMKLRILPLLFTKNLSASMVGDYSARTPVLMTEKLAGGVKGCKGFVWDSDIGCYVPNTVLNLDIRTYVTNQMRIIAVYRKRRTSAKFEEIVYTAKKIDWTAIEFPEGYEDLPRPA